MKILEHLNTGKEKAGSWKALAEVMGIPQTTMSNYKSGDVPIPAKKLALLAQFIERDVGELLRDQQYDRAPEGEKQLWLPFLVKQAGGYAKAASIMMLAYMLVAFGTLFLPSEAKAAYKSMTYSGSSQVIKIIITR